MIKMGPKEGDRRVRKFFAILPRNVGGIIRKFERVDLLQVYTENFGGFWIDVCWNDLSCEKYGHASHYKFNETKTERDQRCIAGIKLMEYKTCPRCGHVDSVKIA